MPTFNPDLEESPMASELLSSIQSEIDARLKELRPLLAEYEQLLAAVDALLDTNPPQDAPPVPKTRRPSRASGAPRARRGSAAGAIARAARGSAVDTQQPTDIDTSRPAIFASEEPTLDAEKPKAARAPRGAAREAILAALDHGSHTVGELVVVTAMSGPNLSGNLRRLVSEGTVLKTEREGKTAYALPD
jgi:DNA-binding transcriptional ArsR family regulator